jgi:hypothetical protein
MILPVLPWLIGVDGQNPAFRQVVDCRTAQDQEDYPGLHTGCPPPRVVPYPHVRVRTSYRN